MKVIGLCGELGSGKNWIATNVVEKYVLSRNNNSNLIFIQVAFADFLKMECMYCSGSPDMFLNQNKTFKVRQYLQQIGAAERAKDPDVWVKKLKYYMQLQEARYFPQQVVFCITDVRFENEMDFVKSFQGLLFKIEAPNRTRKRLEQETNSNFISKWWKSSDISQDISETTVRNTDNSRFDLVINNDAGNANKIVIQNIIANYLKLEDYLNK